MVRPFGVTDRARRPDADLGLLIIDRVDWGRYAVTRGSDCAADRPRVMGARRRSYCGQLETPLPVRTVALSDRDRAAMSLMGGGDWVEIDGG